jgi:hypothetical protein
VGFFVWVCVFLGVLVAPGLVLEVVVWLLLLWGLFLSVEIGGVRNNNKSKTERIKWNEMKGPFRRLLFCSCICKNSSSGSSSSSRQLFGHAAQALRFMDAAITTNYVTAEQTSERAPLMILSSTHCACS